MPLPADHPALLDERLSRRLAGVREVWPSGDFIKVLRYVPARRVTSLVSAPLQPAVLKVFGSPRARGNMRRLRQLAGSGLSDIVPTPLAVDTAGHVALLSYRPGIVLDQVDDESFVRSAAMAGRALARVHSCGATLDRDWTVDDECEQLIRRATATTESLARRLVADAQQLPASRLVPAHRDCHPRQLVVAGGRVAWIDLDDAAMAPAELDVGNFLAHLSREALLERREQVVVDAARHEFLDSYCDAGPELRGLGLWETLSLARLAALAETRHSSPDECRALLSLAEATHQETRMAGSARRAP